MATVGLIASVLQVADIGVRLGNKLISFKSSFHEADESVEFICKDILHTASILRELADTLKQDHEVRNGSDSIYETTNAIVRDCQTLFHEVDRLLTEKLSTTSVVEEPAPTAVNTFQKALWSILKPRIVTLWDNLGKLKSTLLLTLNVIMYNKLLQEK